MSLPRHRCYLCYYYTHTHWLMLCKCCWNCCHWQAGCMYIFGGVTVIEHVRTSSVYRVWLQPPPSLKELSWSWIIEHVPRIGKLPKEKLLQLGIPHDYAWRIAQSLEPGVCAWTCCPSAVCSLDEQSFVCDILQSSNGDYLVSLLLKFVEKWCYIYIWSLPRITCVCVCVKLGEARC